MVERTIPRQALKKILKSQGAQRVSDEALDIFVKKLEEKVETITQDSLKYARHAKRKTILASDVSMALKHVD